MADDSLSDSSVSEGSVCSDQSSNGSDAVTEDDSTDDRSTTTTATATQSMLATDEDNKPWLKFDDIALTYFDKNVLESATEWLTDTIINASQHLLTKQFPAIKGLQNVLLNEIGELKPIGSDDNFVQIVHNGGDHWIVLSNATTTRKNDICALYDSRQSANQNDQQWSREVHKAIFNLMTADVIKIVVKPVSQQPDAHQCGLYAIAFARVLCSGDDPSDVLFADSPQLLRSHLKFCLEKEEITPFPTGSQTIVDSSDI